MAQWKKVQVKVKGRLVTRWTDGKGNYRYSDPNASSKLRTALSMDPEAKAARRGAVSNLDNRINKAVEGAVNKVKSDFSKFNTTANQAFSVKPQPSKSQSAKPKPKPKPDSTPVKPKPKPKPDSTPVKPKPKPDSTPAKPKPKPKQETVNGKTVTRVGPVSTPADKPKMNKLKIDKAMASTRKAYLKNLQEEAKRKSLEQAKKNRARGQRRGGPRGH